MSGTFFYATGAADSNGYIEGPQQKRYRQDNGWQIGRVFRGPTTNEAAFLTTVHPSVQDVDISYEGPVSVVALWYASQTADGDTDKSAITPKDPILTAWSVTANTHILPLLTHPKYSAAEPSDKAPYALGQSAVAVVLEVVNRYKRAVSSLDSDSSARTTTSVALEDYANVLITGDRELGVTYSQFSYPPDTDDYRLERIQFLFRELAVGNDDWEFVQPVLRKVQVLRSSSETKASFTGIQRAYSWERLKQLEPTLDTAVIIGVETLEDLNGEEVWVWQKRPPTVEIASDGKRMLTQEYWGWQAFDTNRYGDIIT